MTFSALPYTPHELENARHLYELPRDDNRRSSAALLSSAAWAATTAGAQSPMQTPALRWRRELRSVLRFKIKIYLAKVVGIIVIPTTLVLLRNRNKTKISAIFK